MNYRISTLLVFLSSAAVALAQNPSVHDEISTSNAGEREIAQAAEIKNRGEVHYSDFGAVGDGQTDDMEAIIATHAFANQENLPVKADAEARYFIGGKERTAIIRTDTDFGSAEFIIDDTDVENNKSFVFQITSNLSPFDLTGISSLKRNQAKINSPLPGPCVIVVTNSGVRRYIRFGLNQNNGKAQTDIFAVDATGNVDAKTPIVWDFEDITEIQALPIDQDILTITGGRFTSIANQEESRYNYFWRGIAIMRSNVIVDGLEHRIQGELEHGAPYHGFLAIRDCANVNVQNTILTGHKTYRTIGSAGDSVSMGSYDISITRALNISFLNCSQTNNIDDRTYWGIMGSNYCKNLVYDNCIFSRFDAHMGVANATIRNSTMGHMGINAIGFGLLTVENSTIRGRTLINLRRDYGSTWRGEIQIRNCTFVPAGGKSSSASLIGGSNSSQHDFGYTCYMPEKITIDTLHIDDSNHPYEYLGTTIFADFNPKMTNESYKEEFPYIKTKKVVLNNVTTASGKELRICDNPFIFRDVVVE